MCSAYTVVILFYCSIRQTAVAHWNNPLPFTGTAFLGQFFATHFRWSCQLCGGSNCWRGSHQSPGPLPFAPYVSFSLWLPQGWRLDHFVHGREGWVQGFPRDYQQLCSWESCLASRPCLQAISFWARDDLMIPFQLWLTCGWRKSLFSRCGHPVHDWRFT